MDKENIDHLVQSLSHESMQDDQQAKGKFQLFCGGGGPQESWCPSPGPYPLRMIAYDDM